MRNAFIKTLVELAEKDDRIILLTGDLGYTVVEAFADKFPSRFFNVGVAEQNMLGMATGLSEAGFIPFVYSIVTFAVLRPYEFIRNGPIVHQLPVRIVGVGDGFEYGSGGVTHHGLEDVGLMRIQPDITIIAPADYEQARSSLLSTWNLPGPIYYRIGKDDKTKIPELNGSFTLGRLQEIRHGRDVLIITMGSITNEVIAASDVLAKKGVLCTIVVISSMNPSPEEDLIFYLNKFYHVLTVEAHFIVGGLGSLVSEVVAECGLQCKVVRCGVRNNSSGLSGGKQYLYKKHKLSAPDLVETVLNNIQIVSHE